MKPYTRFSTFPSLSLWLIPGLVQAQLRLPFSRQIRDPSNVVVGRGSDPSLSLWGDGFVYVVNATVGTPGQDVALVVSSSVADTWVPDATSSYCNFTEAHGYNYQDGYKYNLTYSSYCHWGSFNKSASSTFQSADYSDEWMAQTPDSSFTEGLNFTDTLTVGDVTLENLPMGLATSSDQWIGSLGLGANYSEYGEVYNNFPDRLVQAGTIATKAYSIWLDAEDGSSGSLLMGAVDTSRYQGTLTRMDGVAYTGGLYGSFGTTVNSVNGSSSSSAAAEAFTTDQLPFSAFIGTGETFSNLPDPVAEKMWSMAGATYNTTINLATIPCDAASAAKDGGARFNLVLAGADGPVLDVRLADLIIPQTVAVERWGSGSPDGAAPPGTCLFAVQNGSTWYGVDVIASSSSSEYCYNLGAALLRRSYMVFDLVNSEVAVAPVVFGATAAASNVVAFESYGAVAPSSTAYCIEGGSGCATAGGTSTSGPASSDPTDSDPGSVDVGLIVGLSVAFGLITLVGLIAAFVVWAKMLRNKPPVKEVESDAARDEGDSAATDRTPVAQGGAPTSTLPAVGEEMTEASAGNQAPQLAAAPSVAPSGHAGGGGQWPLQDGSAESESPPRDAPHESTGEADAAVDKGKGKEVATGEDH